jgi:hypothetical protein
MYGKPSNGPLPLGGGGEVINTHVRKLATKEVAREIDPIIP